MPATLTPVNADYGVASGNSTLRDGDHAWLIVEFSNTGDVNWSGDVRIAVEDVDVIPIQIQGLSTIAVNFTLDGTTTGPLTEGMFSLVIELWDVNGVGEPIDSNLMVVEVGPPPLPRAILSMTTNPVTPSLGELVNWTVQIENTGESTWQGMLHCDFPLDVELLGHGPRQDTPELLPEDPALARHQRRRADDVRVLLDRVPATPRVRVERTQYRTGLARHAIALRVRRVRPAEVLVQRQPQ